jgi:hypothetical protein
VLYLLDANILITAHNNYYPIDQVPEFWSWLQHQGASGHAKLPLEMYEEILEGRRDDDLLLDWIKNDANRDALLFGEVVSQPLVQRAVSEGYADDLTDDEIEKLGRDPFLLAYALAGAERCIVTTEVSKPMRVRHNRHIPDVCNSLTITCVRTVRV